jgi:hypothetical protein
MSNGFVPADFEVPTRLTSGELELTPLGPQHNEPDYRAWTSSIEHIRATPGFAGHDWPHEMSLEDNLGDLRRHAEDFAQRKGFTYTVKRHGEIVGCLYLYPIKDRPGWARARSWVSRDHAELDRPLYEAVSEWLKDWPFDGVEYAAR